MLDVGPEIRRAVSGNLEDEEYPAAELEEPMHRVRSLNIHFASVFKLIAFSILAWLYFVSYS